MFELFTDSARRVGRQARNEAILLSRDQIYPEHILLALLHDDAGIAALALQAESITLEAGRQEVRRLTGQDESATAEDTQLPAFGGGQSAEGLHGRWYATPAKLVLELSLRESQRLGDDHISPEHILLGLIRANDDTADQVLTRLGTSRNRVLQQVIRLLHKS